MFVFVDEAVAAGRFDGASRRSRRTLDTHLGIDVPDRLAAAWTALQQSWQARHVFTYCDGIVDSKYLQDTWKPSPAGPMRQGQRLTVTERTTRDVLRDTDSLCRVLNQQDSKWRPLL